MNSCKFCKLYLTKINDACENMTESVCWCWWWDERMKGRFRLKRRYSWRFTKDIKWRLFHTQVMCLFTLVTMRQRLRFHIQHMNPCMHWRSHAWYTMKWLIASAKLRINVSFTMFIGFLVNRFTSTIKWNQIKENKTQINDALPFENVTKSTVLLIAFWKI